MAIAKFLGIVRGYSVEDDGNIRLLVDELNHGERATEYIHDADREFDAKKAKSYQARNAPCAIRPGFASYYFVVKPDEAKGIMHGNKVQVEIDCFAYRKPAYFDGRGWVGLPEPRYVLISIRPDGEPRQEPKANPGRNSAASA